jgi:citrate lyase synthetase
MLSLGIKVIIFVTSVMTSLITGYIKVEKIQETIELVEEHKLKWMDFMYSLTSELQVGMNFRNDASIIINAKKEEFNII